MIKDCNTLDIVKKHKDQVIHCKGLHTSNAYRSGDSVDIRCDDLIASKEMLASPSTSSQASPLPTTVDAPGEKGDEDEPACSPSPPMNMPSISADPFVTTTRGVRRPPSSDDDDEHDEYHDVEDVDPVPESRSRRARTPVDYRRFF